MSPTLDQSRALGSKGAAPPDTPSAMAPGELARWAWRQLTSMRTALLLLLLLALAAVPGSVIPQRRVDQFAVARWQNLHPSLTPVYDKLELFSVYSSIWFSAIYLLLMVSLIGCILPRLRVYWKAVRAAPPAVPRRLGRMSDYHSFDWESPPAAIVAQVETHLRTRHFRIRAQKYEAENGIWEVAAQRGYLREAGNLIFHIAVVVVLVAFAYGSLYGFRGGVIVVTGQGFANSASAYDDFVPGARFDPDSLTPFNLTLEAFQASFLPNGPQAGMPTSFSADVSYEEKPGAPERKQRLEVNHPLQIGDTSLFLVGHGYAPVVTVRDGQGNVAYSGPVVFLPEDGSFASFGVIKAPDALPQQLGFEGMFLPTYGFTKQRGAYSAFPDTLAPVLTMTAYRGDLGLDSGQPQSVYSLDKSDLNTFPGPKGQPLRVDLTVGATRKLPDGAGSITFDGVQRWARLQTSSTPGERLALAAVVVALLGMMGSLFVRPLRIWVRAGDDGSSTAVEIAGLGRTEGQQLATEIGNLIAHLTKEKP